jgi:hypothetical protein
MIVGNEQPNSISQRALLGLLAHGFDYCARGERESMCLLRRFFTIPFNAPARLLQGKAELEENFAF